MPEGWQVLIAIGFQAEDLAQLFNVDQILRPSGFELPIDERGY